MKRYLLLIFCITCLTATAQKPQGTHRPHMSPEEFQTKQKEFIIQHAGLTEEESATFFPLYYELQQKKHEINGRVWKQARAVPPHELAEEECYAMIDALADIKIECATLEKEYLAKFKTILPAKKLMRVQMAEDRFQRELLRNMHDRKHKTQK